MKRMRTTPVQCAFTLVELLVVVVIVFVIAASLLPALSDRNTKSSNTLLKCMNHQRRITVAGMIYTGDHGQKYPWQVSTTNGGTMELALTGSASDHLKPIHSTGLDLKYFVCPSDTSRRPAEGIDELADQNLSYFVNLDTFEPVTGTTSRTVRKRPPSESVLFGDRHLEIDSKPVARGQIVVDSKALARWTKELHSKTRTPSGIISFADGHAETIINDNTILLFQRDGLPTHRLVIP